MKKLFFVVLSVCTFSFCYSQQQADDITTGVFLRKDGKSKVQFFKSGETYSAKIVWLKVPYDKDGKPHIDKKNPDKKLQTRPIMGMVIITGLRFIGNGEYVGGQCYRPTDGDEVKLKVKLSVNGELDVTGSKFGISKTEKWQRE